MTAKTGEKKEKVSEAEKQILAQYFVSLSIIMLLLTVTGCLAQAFREPIRKTDGYRIEAVYQKGKSNPLTFNDLLLLKKSFPENHFSGTMEILTDTLTASGEQIPVKMIGTEENGIAFIPFLSMEQGVFIASDMCERQSKAAVISEALAGRLFLNKNVIGNSFILGESKYRVVGVYREWQSLPAFMADDGLSRVYVPYSALSLEQKTGAQAVEVLYADWTGSVKKSESQEEEIDGGDESNGNPFALAVQSTLMKNLSGYSINEYKEPGEEIAVFAQISLFFLGLWTTFLIIRYLVLRFKRLITYMNHKGEAFYFRETFKRSLPCLLRHFGVLALGVSAIAIIFVLAKPQLVISTRYIPEDNVFDIPFYFDRLKDAIMRENSSSLSSRTYFEALFNRSLVSAFILFTFMVINFVYYQMSSSVLKSLAVKKAKIIKYACSALFTGAAAGWGTAYLLGFPAAFPADYFFVFFLFVFVGLQRENKSEEA